YTSYYTSQLTARTNIHTLSLHDALPISTTDDKEKVYKLADFFYNRMIVVPAVEGKLAEELDEMMKEFNFLLYEDPEDEEIFSKGIGDYLGLNLYNRQYVKDWESGETEIFHNNRGAQSNS